MLYEYNLIRKKVSDDDVQPIRNAINVVDYAFKYLFEEEEMWREKCWAVFLNGGNIPTGHYLVSVGCSDRCNIDKKNITEAAILSHSVGVVLVHNHPDGNPAPSQADILQTENLKKCISVFDIHLLDHVVIGDGHYFSFTENVTKPFKR